MTNADRTRSLKEMAATLSSELAKQADFDQAIIRKARESVFDAAQEAYLGGPRDATMRNGSLGTWSNS